MAKHEKRQLTYVQAHNQAVERFRKASRILIWAGIFNVMGIGIGIGQIVSGVSETMPFYFCFGIVDFLFNLLLVKINDPYIEFLLVGIIALIFSAGAILVSVFASQGKKKPLIIGTGLYFLDWMIVLLCYILNLENWTTLAMSSGFHLFVGGCLAIAIYQYFNVINIEKRYKKTEPVEDCVIEENAKGE